MKFIISSKKENINNINILKEKIKQNINNNKDVFLNICEDYIDSNNIKEDYINDNYDIYIGFDLKKEDYNILNEQCKKLRQAILLINNTNEEIEIEKMPSQIHGIYEFNKYKIDNDIFKNTVALPFIINMFSLYNSHKNIVNVFLSLYKNSDKVKPLKFYANSDATYEKDDEILKNVSCEVVNENEKKMSSFDELAMIFYNDDKQFVSLMRELFVSSKNIQYVFNEIKWS